MPTTRPRKRATLMLIIFALFLAPILARAAIYAVGSEPRSWRDADWSSTGLLPKASANRQARVIIFTGTAGAWKGIFAIHSWIVLKHAGSATWTRYDVVGWGEPVRTNNWPADGRWFGNQPVAIADISGADAEKLIPRIETAIANYRFARAGDYQSGPARTATASLLQSCARCQNSALACRPMQSAAISARVSTPA